MFSNLKILIIDGQHYAYNRKKPIGKGTFGEVFECYPYDLSKKEMDKTKPPSAIKFESPKEGETQEMAFERLTCEAEVQNIRIPTRVYRFGNKQIVTFMPKLPGEHIFKNGKPNKKFYKKLSKLSLSQRLVLAALVAQTYAEFHANHVHRDGLRHTDLKPENFLIDIKFVNGKPQFQCHIIDFANVYTRTPVTTAPEYRKAEGHTLELETYSLVSIIAPILGETTLYDGKLAPKTYKYTLNKMKSFLRTEGANKGLKSEMEDVVSLVESMQDSNPHKRPSDLVVVKTLNRAAIACLEVEEKLYEEKTTVNLTGLTPLGVAARDGDYVQAEKILAVGGADGYDFVLMSDLPEAGPEKGKMYLQKEDSKLKYIVKTPKGNVVEGLLDINISELTEESLNAHKSIILKKTSQRGHTYADVNAQDDVGRTPLHCAVLAGHFKLVKLLLEKGADVTQTDGNGRTLLHLAVLAGHFDIAKLLLQSKDINVEQVDDDNRTALFCALSISCRAGLIVRCKLVLLLLEEGADVNQKNGNDETPLHCVVAMGNIDLVKLLIKQGAMVNDTGKRGQTPLHCAIAKGNVKLVALLINKGAAIDQGDTHGETPLHCAVAMGNIDLVRLLINKGAAIDQGDTQGRTPLHYAVATGNTDLVVFLIERGAAIDQKDKQEQTPLDYAVISGNADLVALLRREGAAIKQKDKQGRMPYHFASAKDHVDLPVDPNVTKISQSNLGQKHTFFPSVPANRSALQDSNLEHRSLNRAM